MGEREFPRNGSIDTYIDELLNETNAYTHVKLDMAFEEKGDNSNYNDDDSGDSVERKTEKRPLRNKEAVRKYREKKKARAASLEDEVVKLRAINEQLVRRLQSQSALEAEVARLKCLLVDIRGRIEGEIGSYPYQMSLKSLDSFENIANLGL